MFARQKFKTLRDGFMIFKIKVRLIANLNDRVIFLRILSCNFIITRLNYIIKTFFIRGYSILRWFIDVAIAVWDQMNNRSSNCYKPR